jgi:hypothetical protein
MYEDHVRSALLATPRSAQPVCRLLAMPDDECVAIMETLLSHQAYQVKQGKYAPR